MCAAAETVGLLAIPGLLAASKCPLLYLPLLFLSRHPPLPSFSFQPYTCTLPAYVFLWYCLFACCVPSLTILACRKLHFVSLSQVLGLVLFVLAFSIFVWPPQSRLSYPVRLCDSLSVLCCYRSWCELQPSALRTFRGPSRKLACSGELVSGVVLLLLCCGWLS